LAKSGAFSSNEHRDVDARDIRTAHSSDLKAVSDRECSHHRRVVWLDFFHSPARVFAYRLYLIREVDQAINNWGSSVAVVSPRK
jgi:hypothetical protein